MEQELTVFERARIFLAEARLRQELGIEAKVRVVRDGGKSQKKEETSA